MSRSLRRDLVALLVIALAGFACRLPGGKSPPIRYWVLEPVAGIPADAPEIVIGVGPFEFPAYLDRMQLVTRVGANELQIAEFDNWGDSLGRSFREILARNLDILLSRADTVVFPWKARVEVQYQLSGSVNRFEVEADRDVAVLRTSWLLTRAADDQVVARGFYDRAEELGDRGTAAGVDAMSRVLAELAREIARTLEPLTVQAAPAALEAAQ